MHLWLKASTAVILSLSLVACTVPGEQGGINNQSGGVLTGGLLGGLLGSQVGHGGGQVVAIVGGTLLGGILGGRIGASMDKTDRMRLSNSLETTPTNQSNSWVNPDNNQNYTVVPLETYQRQGRTCRRFRTAVIIDGTRTTAMGRACRNDQGVWIIVND